MLVKANIIILLLICSAVTGVSLAKKGHIDIVTEHYPPYQVMDDDGKIAGSFVDIVNDVMQRSHIPSNTRMLPWARAYHIAQTVPNTCIFGIVRESFREDLFIWVAELGRTFGTFYTSKDQVDTVKLSSMDDVYNYVIAVQRNGITTELLQRRGFAFQQNLLDVTGWDQALNLVAKGRANLVVSSDEIIAYYLKQMNLPSDTFVPLMDYDDGDNAREYFACHLKTEPELISRLKQAFQQRNAELSQQQ